ncbi:hypothetical protein SGFS_022940 [Streptomyces graminofaciens]|uniref:Transposase n=1 Tax=Streptomyces graminofaciens TaxID=68212 RepID=A0ABN5VCF8_9ACTN|nr:hypothetical protein SGFS_022940 [Streptomyces graminofaciens]
MPHRPAIGQVEESREGIHCAAGVGPGYGNTRRCVSVVREAVLMRSSWHIGSKQVKESLGLSQRSSRPKSTGAACGLICEVPKWGFHQLARSAALSQSQQCGEMGDGRVVIE